jgi:hypothetical protein
MKLFLSISEARSPAQIAATRMKKVLKQTPEYSQFAEYKLDVGRWPFYFDFGSDSRINVTKDGMYILTWSDTATRRGSGFSWALHTPQEVLEQLKKYQERGRPSVISIQQGSDGKVRVKNKTNEQQSEIKPVVQSTKALPAPTLDSASYKKGNRVIVKVGRGEYMLATITAVRSGKWHLLFDDGDKGVADDIADFYSPAGSATHTGILKRVDLPTYRL